MEIFGQKFNCVYEVSAEIKANDKSETEMKSRHFFHSYHVSDKKWPHNSRSSVIINEYLRDTGKYVLIRTQREWRPIQSRTIRVNWMPG